MIESWDYKHPPIAGNASTSFERTVILRDANVRVMIPLIEEDVMKILKEYDVGTLVEREMEKIFRGYDAKV